MGPPGATSGAFSVHTAMPILAVTNLSHRQGQCAYCGKTFDMNSLSYANIVVDDGPPEQITTRLLCAPCTSQAKTNGVLR